MDMHCHKLSYNFLNRNRVWETRARLNRVISVLALRQFFLLFLYNWSLRPRSIHINDKMHSILSYCKARISFVFKALTPLSWRGTQEVVMFTSCKSCFVKRLIAAPQDTTGADYANYTPTWPDCNTDCAAALSYTHGVTWQSYVRLRNAMSLLHPNS